LLHQLANAHSHEFLSASNFRSANVAPVRQVSNQFNPFVGASQQSFAPPQDRKLFNTAKIYLNALNISISFIDFKKFYLLLIFFQIQSSEHDDKL
jgi:hypothetical protein